jgi:hypothetical protein
MSPFVLVGHLKSVLSFQSNIKSNIIHVECSTSLGRGFEATAH